MSVSITAKNSIRLFVFDMDGTALGGHTPYAQFPRPFVDFLDALADRGIQWATNTTWAPEAQFELMQRSKVRSRPAFLSGSTGRALATVTRGKLTSDATHTEHIVRLERQFRRQHNAAVKQALRRLLRGNLVDQLSFNAYDQNLFSYRAERGKSRRVWAVVAPLLAGSAYYPWHPHKRAANTFLPYYMNKGDIVGTMQARLGIGPEHTIVAGDASNDLHMFNPSVARHMVCPANAEPLIKQTVAKHQGVVSKRKFCWGVIQGVEQVLRAHTSPQRIHS